MGKEELEEGDVVGAEVEVSSDPQAGIRGGSLLVTITFLMNLNTLVAVLGLALSLSPASSCPCCDFSSSLKGEEYLAMH